MKQFKASNALSVAISKAADQVAQRVLKHFEDTGVNGREEIVTPQLAGELTDHLLDNIVEKIPKHPNNGIIFDAFCYKKSEENKVGADLAGAISFVSEGKKCTKAFLAQAKVASKAIKNDDHHLELKAGDRRLLSQCLRMLRITPDSFVFIYSQFGIHVVPAISVVRARRSWVDTTEDYYRELGGFYGEFFKCFIGDPKIGQFYRASNKLLDFSKKVRAQRAVIIEAKTKG